MKARRHSLGHEIPAQRAFSHQAGIYVGFSMISMEQYPGSYLEPTEVV